MSEEEKEEKKLKRIKFNNNNAYCNKDDIDFLLNLIEKQQTEYDLLLNGYNKLVQEHIRAEKAIDKIAQYLEQAKLCYFKKQEGGEFLGKYRSYNKQDWIEYFYKESE